MVEYQRNLNVIFRSLADKTRRDILHRVTGEALSIKDIAKPYRMSFAAIAKHVNVLEAAKLVKKKREGKEQIVSAVPETIASAERFFEEYKKTWNSRLDALDSILRR